MRKLIKTLLSPAILLMPIGTAGFAVGEDVECTSEIQCDSNLYCQTIIGSSACTTCPTTHPNSPLGSTNKNQCYLTCPSKPGFENGTWVPDADNVNHPNECKYTKEENITCNGPDGKNGYHLEEDKCISNKRECYIKDGTGEQYWTKTTSGYGWGVSCNIASCNSGYHMLLMNSAPEAPFSCKNDTVACSASPVNLIGAAGDAKWSITTPEIPGFNDFSGYDKTGCSKSMSHDTLYGKGSKKCYWSAGTTADASKFETCSDYKMTSCLAGYQYDSNRNEKDCILNDPGYYSTQNDLHQSPCAPGTTSDPGTLGTPKATSSTACFIKGGLGGTLFCDDRGCFNLPVSVPYAPK